MPEVARPIGGSGWGVEHLADADRVAERVADAEVDAVGLVSGSSVTSTPRSFSTSKVACASSVVKNSAAADRALGEELPDLRGGGVVHDRRARPLEQDLARRVAGDARR